MSITTPQIRSYKKDTHSNIVNSSSIEDGQWAFAVDTGSIFLSRDGGWIEWSADSRTGSHTFTDTSDQQITLPYSPIAHLDAANLNSMLTARGVAPSDGDSISEWQSVNSGTYTVKQPRASERPEYDANGLGTGRPAVHFKGTTMATGEEFNSKSNHGDYTVIMALRLNKVMLNNDRYMQGGTSYTDKPQTNQVISDIPDFSLFGSAVDSYAQSGTSGLSSSIEFKYDTNTFNYLEWLLMGGNVYWDDLNLVDIYTGDGDVAEGGFDGSLHAGLRALGAGVDTNWILTFRVASRSLNSHGLIERAICGGAYTHRYTTNIGTFSMRGLGIGIANTAMTPRGGNFMLGEMFVYNDLIETGHLNQIGSYLSAKWSAPWVQL